MMTQILSAAEAADAAHPLQSLRSADRGMAAETARPGAPASRMRMCFTAAAMTAVLVAAHPIATSLSVAMAQDGTQAAAAAPSIPVRGNNAPRVSPNAMVGQTIGTTIVTLTYGRPSVRDRVIFGGLVPFGQVWRTGANEATSLATTGDLTFADGQVLPAGTYSLYTLPSEDGSWTVIINSIGSWGTQYDPAGDVMRVAASAESGAFTELMGIGFENVDLDSADLVIRWERTALRVPLSVAAVE